MTPRLTRPRRSKRARAFYEVALSEADRADLAHARRVEGLADEIALLRLQLRRALEQDPLDSELLHAGVRLLVQALLAQRRLSPTQADEVNNTLASTLELFGRYMRDAVDA
jgi:hypothetical protein